MLPHELLKLRSFVFNEITAEQTRRFLTFNTTDELEIIQQQRCELILACRSEEPLFNAKSRPKNMLSFSD